MNAHSNVEANNLISETSFSSAVENFQRFAGIPVTGEFINHLKPRNTLDALTSMGLTLSELS